MENGGPLTAQGGVVVSLKVFIRLCWQLPTMHTAPLGTWELHLLATTRALYPLPSRRKLLE